MARTIDLDMVNRYIELQEQMKKIEEELVELKQMFHEYFDEVAGRNLKGEVIIGNYKIQRQVRESFSYHESKTVQVLEELNLSDCVKLKKVPDEEKIEAALTLGIISRDALKECIMHRITPAIVVRKLENEH